MNRLAFVMENGSRLSTDVLPGQELDDSIEELTNTMARVMPEHVVQEVIYYRYTLENRKAFVQHPVPVDMTSLNTAVQQRVRGEVP
jgi:hypothetical protein